MGGLGQKQKKHEVAVTVVIWSRLNTFCSPLDPCWKISNISNLQFDGGPNLWTSLHELNTCHVFFHYFENILQIRSSLTFKDTVTFFVLAFTKTLKRLQTVEMWAARLLAGVTRRDHISLVWDFFRINFKLLLICFNGSALSYISDLLAPYAPYAPVCASRSFLCYRCLNETNTEQTGHEALGKTGLKSGLRSRPLPSQVLKPMFRWRIFMMLYEFLMGFDLSLLLLVPYYFDITQC